MARHATKSSLEGKVPPQNIEAEQSVLGALLLDKEAIMKVADIIQTRDFYQKNHQIIYDTILHLYERQDPIDLINLSNRLSQTISVAQEGNGKSRPKAGFRPAR